MKPSHPTREHIVIRSAVPADSDALARLAALDSRRPPHGDALVAEADAELVAAVGVEDGRTIADPFRPTADAVALLELRARQLLGERRGPARAAAHGAHRFPLAVRRTA